MNFMQKNGHTRIDGASIIPHNDPTLLFINAGMAPLKDFFTGKQKPIASDLCNIQPCIRTIDIDDVGDRHHLTFFEMLGSWSINNYYKDRAINLAYDLLTENFGFPKERLYVTVFAGNEAQGIPADTESYKFWQEVGIPKNHIVMLGEDNFWSAGDTGPCGPCTEIFFDTGDKHGDSYEKTGIFDTKDRYIEIWNAGVFMQYNRQPDGTFEKLPFMSIDTGSGLERMVMTLNEKESVYDTDVFKPYMETVCETLNLDMDSQAPSIRRIVDHIRAATLILSEDVVPNKEGRNYIPRRLIRRSASIALLHDKPQFSFTNLAKQIISEMGEAYPLMKKNKDTIIQTLAQELISFQKSVKRGVSKFDKMIRNATTLSGKDIFDLRASFGLPLDLLQEISKERNISLDMNGYKQEFLKHQQISRNLDR